LRRGRWHAIVAPAPLLVAERARRAARKRGRPVRAGVAASFSNSAHPLEDRQTARCRGTNQKGGSMRRFAVAAALACLAAFAVGGIAGASTPGADARLTNDCHPDANCG